jgi:hypothetical protein
MRGVEPWQLSPRTPAVRWKAAQERGELVNVTWLDGERRHTLTDEVSAEPWLTAHRPLADRRLIRRQIDHHQLHCDTNAGNWCR